MKKINLTRGLFALVDDEDYERLSEFNWTAKKDRNMWYAKTYFYEKGVRVHRLMHRMILKPNKKICIDHIDRDGLNNQKSNLRFVTNSQNQMNTVKRAHNTSGFKGVTWDKQTSKWKVHISVNKKQVSLGRFAVKRHAVLIYNNAVQQHYGQYAQGGAR